MVKSATITITVTTPGGGTGIPGSFSAMTVNGVAIANGGNAGSFPLGSTITIAGTLLDTAGVPIAGFTVQDLSPTGKVQATAVTNASGQFSLSGVAAAKGTFTTYIVPLGYATTIKYAITFTVV